jgi:pyruvate carboxylase subunit B
MFGRWEKIDAGYGRSVLGYFGKTPLPSDPEVIDIASNQLNLPVFDGDPLEAAPKNIEPAQEALVDLGLEVNNRNTFLVLASMVPGKKLELNEGIRLLTGKPKIDVPLKKKEEPKAQATPKPAAPAPVLTGPKVTRCTIKENGRSRTFEVTLEPLGESIQSSAVSQNAESSQPGTGVFSAFAGAVEVVDIMAKVGDTVEQGDIVAAVEAMKATHDIKAPCAGKVSEICTEIGQEIDSSQPIMTIS